MLAITVLGSGIAALDATVVNIARPAGFCQRAHRYHRASLADDGRAGITGIR